MNEWQLIETAPKDGTCVLLFTTYGCIEGFWSDDEFLQDVCAASYDMAYTYIQCYPTHWMPLPPPPAS